MRTNDTHSDNCYRATSNNNFTLPLKFIHVSLIIMHHHHGTYLIVDMKLTLFYNCICLPVRTTTTLFLPNRQKVNSPRLTRATYVYFITNLKLRLTIS